MFSQRALIAFAIPMLCGPFAVLLRGQTETLSEVGVVPRDDAAVASLIESIALEIEELKKNAEPKAEEGAEPAPNEKQRSETVKKLLESLNTYQTLLKEYQSLRLVNAEQAAAQFAQELAELEDKVNQWKKKNKRLPRQSQVTEQQINEAKDQLETEQSNLAAREEASNKRSTRLDSFVARKAEVQERLLTTKADLIEISEEAEARIQAAANPVERQTAEARLRSARINVAIAALRLEVLELENQKDKRLAAQAQQRLPLLRDLVSELEKYRDGLQKLKNRSEIDTAKFWVQQVESDPQSVSVYERQYWPVRLEILNAIQELDKLRQEAGYRDRFVEEEKLDLEQGMKFGSDIWNQFLESLSRRPRSQINERYQLVRRITRRVLQNRQVLQEKYDKTWDDLAGLGSKVDQLRDSIRRNNRALSRMTPPADADGRIAELVEQLKVKKEQFDQKATGMIADLEALRDRLQSGIELVDEHLKRLANAEGRLYWTYLTVRDAPIWKYRPSASIEEWNSPAERQRRRQDLSMIRDALYAVSGFQWTVLIAGVGLLVVCAAFVRRQLLIKAARLEARITERMSKEKAAFANLSDRYNVSVLRFLARTAYVLWPALWVLLFVRLSPLDGRLAQAALLFVMAVAVVYGLIRAAFRQAKPRFRLISCSNVVATYYRRRLQLLIWTSLLLVPVPLLLSAVEWAPYTRRYLWSLYVIVVLAGFLLFLSKKNLVLKVFGHREGQHAGRLYTLLANGYPVVLLLVFALLALQILGYTALTTHVIPAFVLSVVTLIFAHMLSRYLVGLSYQLSRSVFADEAEGETPPDPPPREKGEPVNEDSSEDELEKESPPEQKQGSEEQVSFTLELFTTALRWTVTVASVFLILRIWGVSWHQIDAWMDYAIISGDETSNRPAVTVGRVLLALLIMAASILVSRTVRAFLQRKISSQSELERGGRVAVGTLVHYFILVLGVYFVLFVMRIPLGAITVLLGTLGFGLGLGLQPVFVNFISGLIMLFERHLKVGDRVEVEGVAGEVTQMGIRSTTIKTFDNVDLVIPNSQFINAKVVNWTLKETVIRGKLDVGVSYSSDPRLVKKLLAQVARESPLVLREPAPAVRFMNFGESSLDFSLYVWFKNSSDRWEFLTQVRFRILDLFRQHGIEIPFPQRTLSTLGGGAIKLRVEQPSAEHEPASDSGSGL